MREPTSLSGIPKALVVLSEKQRLQYLGTSWGEGSRDAKQDALLPLEQVSDLDILVWGPFLEHNVGQR